MRRLSQETLGFDPPPIAANAGRYAPFVMFGGIVAIVQGPLIGETMPHRGRIGEKVDIAQAFDAARLCAANVLVQLQAACGGDLDRVQCCYRLGGFLNTVDGFTEHSKVMNAASDIIHAVLGADMRHSRYVVGCNSLPYDLVMELEGWFAIRS